MNRKKIGLILFWFGVLCIIIFLVLTWYQSPIHRIHTADELRGTIHAIWGILFWIRIMGGSGVTFTLVGVLLYTGEKGSYFWLLGLLPHFATFGEYWHPAKHLPWLFGIGGTVILFSYIGILWLWTRIYTAYKGIARTGRKIQLLGYTFLVVASLLLCMYFGNPKQLALAELPIPGGEIINLTLSIGMLLIFVGYYLVARGSKKATTGL